MMTKSKESPFYYHNNGAISASFRFSPTNPYLDPSVQEGSVLGLLLSTGSIAQTTATPTMASPLTRTGFKQQLQKQHLEQIEQQEKKLSQSFHINQESQSISIPANMELASSAPTLPPHEVPTSVLQVNNFIIKFLSSVYFL
jgi:hypothetical protein